MILNIFLSLLNISLSVFAFFNFNIAETMIYNALYVVVAYFLAFIGQMMATDCPDSTLVVRYRNALLTMLTFHIIVWSGIGIYNIIKWKKHYNQDGWRIGVYQPK